MPHAEHDLPAKRMALASSFQRALVICSAGPSQDPLSGGGASSLRLRMTIGSIQELLARARGKAPGGASGGRTK